MECSGNSDPSNFGSDQHRRLGGRAAARAARSRQAAVRRRIACSSPAFDDMTARPRTSVPGASWIFTRDQLERALLAVAHERRAAAARPRLPGPPDRARLVRLQLHQVGRSHRDRAGRCAGDDADAGVRGENASGYRGCCGRTIRRWRGTSFPAVIDTAAMPVRVEKWIAGGRVEYRITGIIWGGATPTNALSIRFRTSEPWMPRRRLPAAGVDADLEPVDPHLAPDRARPLPDRLQGDRPVDPHAPARSVLLRPRNVRSTTYKKKPQRPQKIAEQTFFSAVSAISAVPSYRDNARTSASSGRSLSARCHAARKSFARLDRLGVCGPATLAARARPSSDCGAAGRAGERGLELHHRGRRVAGAEQDLGVELAGRLDRVRTRDRPRPLRLRAPRRGRARPARRRDRRAPA